MRLIVDGKGVHTTTGGAPAGADQPMVLFIHGAGMDHTVWSLQTRYFAHHGFSVLALDLPGHGRSDGPALASIEAIADWIAQVIDAAGATEAALVGHSMGALSALDCAARHPDKVRALALLGAAAAMPVNDALIESTRDDPDSAIEMIVAFAYGDRAQLGGMRAPGLWMTAAGRRLLQRGPEGVLHDDFSACNAYAGGAAAAGKVACPTLVLAGRRDRMTPYRAGRDLAEAISGATIEGLPDCGHMMMVEQPDETLAALRKFL